jgi:energy-coupling factor transporter ATP-binding protein EcfA2
MAEVIEFAELGDFIDQPVRTYSSGMQVRLGFAVASSVNPDVLIVDEALGVGDAYFQKKSLDRVRHFRDRGLTFLFVTHALPLVQRFCTKCLWLREGKVEDLGDTSKVVRAYQLYSQEKQRRHLGQDQSEIEVNHIESPAEKQYFSPKSRWGNGRIKINQVEMVGEDGRAGWVFQLGEKASLRIHYETAEVLTNAVFSFQIERIDGVYVMGTSNADNNIDCCQLGELSGSGIVEYEMDAMSLHAGTYFLSVQAFAEPDEPYWSDPGDCHFQMYEFRIHSSHRQHGVVALPGRWKRSVTKAESLPWV